MLWRPIDLQGFLVTRFKAGYGRSENRGCTMTLYPDVAVYTPEILISLSDGELAAQLFDAIIASGGEEGHSATLLKAEAERRGLTDMQLSEAYFTGAATIRSFS
jgi:hypothetical protein